MTGAFVPKTRDCTPTPLPSDSCRETPDGLSRPSQHGPRSGVFVHLLLVVLGVDPRAWCTPGRHSATEPLSSSLGSSCPCQTELGAFPVPWADLPGLGTDCQCPLQGLLRSGPYLSPLQVPCPAWGSTGDRRGGHLQSKMAVGTPAVGTPTVSSPKRAFSFPFDLWQFMKNGAHVLLINFNKNHGNVGFF